MAKLDGTNGLIQQYDYQVLTTGFTYTFASGTQTLVANPAGTLATGTITMPATPVDGMSITIESTQVITAITVQGNTGQSIVGAPTQLLPNQPVSFIYRVTNTTWYPLAGAGAVAPLVRGTVVTSTSGTYIDFTGIPSWVKRITVMMNGISTNGGSPFLIQIGPSGGIETTGYDSIAGTVTTAANTTRGQGSSAGYILYGTTVASNYAPSGVITLVNISGNSWLASGSMADLVAVGADATVVAGTKTLAGVLTQVRVTTVNGTDVFDAGTVNILYE